MLTVTGIVKKSSASLQLEIATTSSCSSCTMKKKCNQNIKLNRSNFIENENLQENDNLIIAVSNWLFFSYVAIIYGLPLLIFVSTIWFCSYYNLNELTIMAICLLNLAIFFSFIKYSKMLDKFNNSFSVKRYL
jgi:positive regulator of sigma E activity